MRNTQMQTPGNVPDVATQTGTQRRFTATSRRVLGPAGATWGQCRPQQRDLEGPGHGGGGGRDASREGAGLDGCSGCRGCENHTRHPVRGPTEAAALWLG